MLVRILKPTDYTPSADESPRCWGQLRHRPTEKLVQVVHPDGTKEMHSRRTDLPLYFPKGATPDLKDDVAKRLITEGYAEPAGEIEAAVFVSKAEILKDITVN